MMRSTPQPAVKSATRLARGSVLYITTPSAPAARARVAFSGVLTDVNTRAAPNWLAAAHAGAMTDNSRKRHGANSHAQARLDVRWVDAGPLDAHTNLTCSRQRIGRFAQLKDIASRAQAVVEGGFHGYSCSVEYG